MSDVEFGLSQLTYYLFHGGIVALGYSVVGDVEQFSEQPKRLMFR